MAEILLFLTVSLKKKYDLSCFSPEEIISEGCFWNMTYKETDGVFVYSSASSSHLVNS